MRAAVGLCYRIEADPVGHIVEYPLATAASMGRKRVQMEKNKLEKTNA